MAPEFTTSITRLFPDADRPVLIAGPTGAGKSTLALALARQQGGVIINADALQVYDGWRILTARPTISDERAAPHRLYGHVPHDHDYSVGHWLRDIAGCLADHAARPIVVGGTGLYFSALTEGLADIPAVAPHIRREADARLEHDGLQGLLNDLDAATRTRIDTQNPARVRRAWEVQAATGTGLAAWQDDTPAPTLPLADCQTCLIAADRDWLNQRIEARFDAMLEAGALKEARAMQSDWDPDRLSSRAIGARELIATLDGRMTLAEAATQAKTLSRQYAKRQRTWFRARMSGWNRLVLP